MTELLSPPLVRFLVAGALNTGLFYALYVLMVWAGVHYPLALAIEYIGGTVSGYLLNKHWTFADRDAARHGFLRYSLAYVVLFGLNMALLSLLVETAILGPVIGQLVMLFLLTASSFVVQRYWVFGRNKTKD
ncbi:MAG: GtrA family protein [Hydrogenophaga sp.]|uniref:GtrA family protein n=1 Tax=Hydrogenophaga sp. TaxID=1904254 RepID=UPI00272F679C|nr:GtrA family protein [Hydrogenophaga sp.]MDP2407469.1 GtrA family protein [Hydrogenophaga sp.]MDZ4177357.1 GtrA family protein [Hydrogenophaga sp.]